MHPSVLTSFAFPSEYYAPDVAAIMPETVRRFGLEEWRRVVLTNEIHGHLGIYSTLGAKMGLYALSLLPGEDEPTVTSFAGLQPPVSCMNDGLQISTGATIGHGLISVSDEPEKRCEALFERGGKRLRLALKSEYRERICEDIRHGVALYGHTAPYWEYIRQLALRYWSTWDRTTIFLVSEE